MRGRSGLSDASKRLLADWLKSKNPACEAMRREVEEDRGS
jgi:hypothetical protein